MKKLFLYIVSAVIGLCLGIAIHYSFMIVEAEGVKMLPSIVPDQNVLINLMDKDIEPGDVVACKAQFYTLDGEGYIIFRRVKDVKGEDFVLTCDMELAENQEMILSKDDILGKVVLNKTN